MNGPVYPAGPPVSAFDSFNAPVSLVMVLFVRTSTVESLAMVTTPSFAVPDESVNVGVPNEYPTGAPGGGNSVSVTGALSPTGYRRWLQAHPPRRSSCQ